MTCLRHLLRREPGRIGCTQCPLVVRRPDDYRDMPRWRR